ncbi:MAG: choice-of-anchor L domain-containing protein [Bacteroidota bacterium]|nr:choice-of-anchor L domain-containing protein [Bacteroidota bacterium]
MLKCISRLMIKENSISGFYRIVLTLLLIYISNCSFSQLIVDGGSTQTTPKFADSLVRNVLIGKGVKAFNVTYKGYRVINAFGSSIGYFDGSKSNIGLKNGVVLSTGNIKNIAGPVPQQMSTKFSNSGDKDIDSILQRENPDAIVNTYDAAGLEFDFVPTSDSLHFKYVFASSEYGFVGMGTNDAFAFIIRGPGITNDPGINGKNIALIPGTNLPVSIENINNDPKLDPTNTYHYDRYKQYFVDNSNGKTVAFRGFTTVLTAGVKVIPCDTFHIKLVIADNKDDEYDSGVFLEAGSFSSEPVIVKISSVNKNSPKNPAIDNNAVEGCVNGIVSFKLERPTLKNRAIHYAINGTAVNGVDYGIDPNGNTTKSINDSIVIPAGQDSVAILILPFINGKVDSVRTVIFNVVKSLCGGDLESDTLFIKDYQQMKVNPYKTMVCTGHSTYIKANVSDGRASYSYNWNPSSTNSDSILVSPASDITYYTTVTDACGYTVKDSVAITVKVLTPTITASHDSVCRGTLVKLRVAGGKTYSWLNVGQTDLTDSALVKPNATTTYKVIAYIDDCQNTVSYTINVRKNPVPQITASKTTICRGDTISLLASGGKEYLWKASPTDSLLNTQNTMDKVNLIPQIPTTYSVIVVDNHGCGYDSSATQIINFFTGPSLTYTFPKITCVGDTVQIKYTGDGLDTAIYNWSFGGGRIIDNLKLTGPGPHQVSWSTSGTKRLSLTINQNNCISDTQADSISVYDTPLADFDIEDSIGCAPSHSVLFKDRSKNVQEPSEYIWNFGDGNSSLIKPDANYIYTKPGIYDVSLKVVSGTCYNIINKKNAVIIHESPTAAFITEPTSTVSVLEPTIAFMNKSTGADIIKWFLWNDSLVNGKNFVYRFKDTGTYKFTLYAINKFNCKDTLTGKVIITPDYTIYIPNSFTPNGDGKNDIFCAEGYGIVTFEIRIMNRWGQQIFYSKDIKKGWDGKVSGNNVEAGVYMYIVKFTDENNKFHTYQGTITIPRKN